MFLLGLRLHGMRLNPNPWIYQEYESFFFKDGSILDYCEMIHWSKSVLSLDYSRFTQKMSYDLRHIIKVCTAFVDRMIHLKP